MNNMKKVIILVLMLGEAVYALESQSEHPVSNKSVYVNDTVESGVRVDGFSMAISAGFIDMAGNNSDIFNQSRNQDRTSYGLVALSYDYLFEQEDFYALHYGLGVAFYNVIGQGSNTLLPMPKVIVRKQLAEEFSLYGSFGTILVLFDFGVGVSYNISDGASVQLGVNYMPSTRFTNNDHNINAYSFTTGLRYTF
ncbi:hypothetical protein [Cysteiniphilum sp. QT6929]|uniref:hypothetical protein n=1 Tax=Cysteiniphilum sp. QT6929 TaxID=2975055 RepID=UPI0024B3A5F4|nr:hypothetical protein [Cysteiniphilum sp. QT6929]WHN66262.1 hypothetical protein NYP54_03260 [Cysteiniphilum sp. QT6929]